MNQIFLSGALDNENNNLFIEISSSEKCLFIKISDAFEVKE